MNKRLLSRLISPLVISITGALVALVLFERLADDVLEGETIRFDDQVRNTVHSFASPGVTRAMSVLTNIGNIQGVLSVTTVGAAILVHKRRRGGAILLGVTVFGAGILMWTMKILFHRTRPEPFFGIAVPKDFSFPSGHALVAFSFYSVLATMTTTELAKPAERAAVWAGAAAMVSGIGLSRIYLGVHYPSDVAGGYLAASVWVTGVSLVYRRLQHHRRGRLPSDVQSPLEDLMLSVAAQKVDQTVDLSRRDVEVR